MICGKAKPKLDPRTLKLASYLTVRDFHAPPPSRDWSKKRASTESPMLVDALGTIPMHANDRVGDCTVASQAHLIHTWTSLNGATANVQTSDVLANYSAFTGYDPADPTTDTGGAMLDALNYWRKNGLGGHKPLAFMKVDWKNPDELKIALNQFGGLYIGAGLPKTTNKDGDWTAAPFPKGDATPYSRGGHAMALVGYDRSWLTFLTWGGKQRASWRWVQDYVDEAYAILSIDWFKDGVTPNGFNQARLLSDLGKLGLM